MLKDLVKIANRLDSLGLTKEADIIDRYITKSATSKSEDQVAEEIADGIYSSNQNIDENSFKKEFMYRWNNSAYMPGQYDPSLSDWKSQAKVFADKMWGLGQNDPASWKVDTETSLPKATPKKPAEPSVSKPSGNVDWDSYEKNVNTKYGSELGTMVRSAWKTLTTNRKGMELFSEFVKFYNWLTKKKGKSLSPKELTSDMGELDYQLYVYTHESSYMYERMGTPALSKEKFIENKFKRIDTSKRLEGLGLPMSLPMPDGTQKLLITELMRTLRSKDRIKKLEDLSDSQIKDLYQETKDRLELNENPWL